MTQICQSVGDPLARFLCEHLETCHGLELSDFDRGWEETTFVSQGDRYVPIRTRTGLDQAPQTAEIYERTLEIDPWAIDPRLNGDAEIRRFLKERIETIRTSLTRTRLRPGTLEYHLDFGRRIFGLLTRPPREGGLDIRFDREPGGSRTLADVHRDRRATCLEFINLYLTAADIAGIPAVPLELFEDDRRVEMHVGIGFFDPATHRLHTVANFDRIQHFGPPQRDQVWSEISRRELLAYYYNARGVRNPDRMRGEADIDFALRLSPNNYLLLFNKSWFAFDRGAYEEASRLLQEAIRSNPNYSPTYYNLNAVALIAGDTALADWAWGRYQSLRLRP